MLKKKNQLSGIVMISHGYKQSGDITVSEQSAKDPELAEKQSHLLKNRTEIL